MKMRIACSMRSRLRGLLGRRGFSGVLLLAPCNDVHTCGMRHPIDVAFVAPSGEVVESYRRVGPRRRLKCRAASTTLERLSSDAPWFERGDRLELTCRRSDDQKMIREPVRKESS